MKIYLSNIDKTSFNGAKDGVKFRREARSIIKDLAEVPLGSSEYTVREYKNDNSLRDRLLNAIYELPEKIGKKHITDEDRALHEELKSLYKQYQEADDYADAMCGGGGHFIEHTIDYSI